MDDKRFDENWENLSKGKWIIVTGYKFFRDTEVGENWQPISVDPIQFTGIPSEIISTSLPFVVLDPLKNKMKSTETDPSKSKSYGPKPYERSLTENGVETIDLRVFRVRVVTKEYVQAFIPSGKTIKCSKGILSSGKNEKKEREQRLCPNCGIKLKEKLFTLEMDLRVASEQKWGFACSCGFHGRVFK